VRVVCATHCDLERAVAQGRFRQDLYYRVRVVEIDLPALRERGPEDVETLARHFADVYAARYGRPTPRFDPAALKHIRAHAWPGNVRELEHWVESAIALAPDGRITVGHLPARRREDSAPAASAPSEGGDERVALPLGLTLDEAARRYVEAMVRACEGNKTEAAKRLGVGRNTLARALRVKH
jgi:DNA-binding NtrC family response regulator